MYDLVIIGSGPAGLSAAVYAKRAGLNTLIIEKSGMSGGQVLTTYEVDNYLGLPGVGGFDLGMKFRDHADKLGSSFVEAVVNGVVQTNDESSEVELAAASKRDIPVIHKVLTDQGEFETKTVLIATGASHAKLGVTGEERLTGMGVSYCATCDGAFFRNRTVAVVGGGDVAVEDAIFLARTSKKVYLIHRRDTLRSAKILQDNVNQLENVEILWDTVVEEIAGEKKVEVLQLKNVKTGEQTSLSVDGVFVAVGIHPNTEPFIGAVDMDNKGYIVADEDGTTATSGIFVAGDARTKKLRQIITAVSDGANAVTSIQNYFLK